MEITLVKAAGPGGRDHAWLTAGSVTRAARCTSSMTFRTWSSSPCSASLTGCGQNWPPGPTRQPGQAATAREAKRLLQVGRAGRLGNVVQGGITAAPAARAAFGEPVLGEHPQRSRGGRRAQPGRPGDLGAACFRLVKHLIDEG